MRIFFSCASQQQHSEFPAESNHKLRHTLPKYQFAIILKGKLKPKIEFISFDGQSDEILDFRRYLC